MRPVTAARPAAVSPLARITRQPRTACSRRARCFAVKPPPSGYRMTPGYTHQRDHRHPPPGPCSWPAASEHPAASSSSTTFSPACWDPPWRGKRGSPRARRPASRRAGTGRTGSCSHGRPGPRASGRCRTARRTGTRRRPDQDDRPAVPAQDSAQGEGEFHVAEPCWPSAGQTAAEHSVHPRGEPSSPAGTERRRSPQILTQAAAARSGSRPAEQPRSGPSASHQSWPEPIRRRSRPALRSPLSPLTSRANEARRGATPAVFKALSAVP
ncbi:hypothetical protein SAURM35S_03863 [Streptomyces aurantiogriseus]